MRSRRSRARTTRLAAEATRLQSADDLRVVAEQALAGGRRRRGRGRRRAERGQRRPQGTRAVGRRIRCSPSWVAGWPRPAIALAEVAGDLAGYLGDLEVEPGRLEQIAERRSALSGLTRKYGSSVDEVLAWAATAAVRLVELEGGDERIERARGAGGRAGHASWTRWPAAISAARRTAAAAFAERVLPSSRRWPCRTPGSSSTSSRRAGSARADQVELLFSANPGSEPQSLAKVASGGELSRVRLALEVVLAAGQSAETLVFDEVDAGVGGRVAVEIGRRLAELARHSQVIVVTHLAQVAAFADRHYVVVKSDDGQVTTSGVQLVLRRASGPPSWPG